MTLARLRIKSGINSTSQLHVEYQSSTSQSKTPTSLYPPHQGIHTLFYSTNSPFQPQALYHCTRLPAGQAKLDEGKVCGAPRSRGTSSNLVDRSSAKHAFHAGRCKCVGGLRERFVNLALYVPKLNSTECCMLRSGSYKEIQLY